MHLRKELLEAKHRLAELEPAWEMFIAKHNDEEEAQESEQRRRAAVVAQLSERRNRRLENEANRVELRVATSIPPSDVVATTSQLATPRGADNDLSGARDSGSTSTLGMFSPAVSTGLESSREPGRFLYGHGRLRRGVCYRVQPRHSKRARAGGASGGHGFFLGASLASTDSMRKTTLANLETKTLKAFRNIFAHHKNAHAKISDWISYIPVELHTQVRARIRSVVDLKTDEKRFTTA